MLTQLWTIPKSKDGILSLDARTCPSLDLERRTPPSPQAASLRRDRNRRRARPGSGFGKDLRPPLEEPLPGPCDRRASSRRNVPPAGIRPPTGTFRWFELGFSSRLACP